MPSLVLSHSCRACRAHPQFAGWTVLLPWEQRKGTQTRDREHVQDAVRLACKRGSPGRIENVPAGAWKRQSPGAGTVFPIKWFLVCTDLAAVMGKICRQGACQGGRTLVSQPPELQALHPGKDKARGPWLNSVSVLNRVLHSPSAPPASPSRGVERELSHARPAREAAWPPSLFLEATETLLGARALPRPPAQAPTVGTLFTQSRTSQDPPAAAGQAS